MPNITYINILASTIAIMAVSTAVTAQTLAPKGCYKRDYSAAHLAKNPDQVVDDITVGFYAIGGATYSKIMVLTANQGHAARDGLGGRYFVGESLECQNSTEAKTGWSCYVECDAGSMHIKRIDSKILEFRTNWMWIGDSQECGGPINLAEIENQWVTYRLNRVDDEYCQK